ncbi:MAG: OsmC family protein [Paracoccaceae bacterium]|nr:OsmC family protein [Paracoccaceae bacterium]
MAIKMKAFVDMKMTGSSKSHARTDISARDVTAIIDEPVARGGTNLGLTPTETLISALVSCTNVITNRLAHKLGAEVGSLEIAAVAKFDRRGATIEEEIDLPFPEIVLDIAITTDATPAQMDQIKADLGRFCPIAKVIRAAGTDIVENWTVSAL